MEVITLMTPFSTNKRIGIQMNTNILQSGFRYKQAFSSAWLPYTR